LLNRRLETLQLDRSSLREARINAMQTSMKARFDQI